MASDWNGLPENPERDGWHWLARSRDHCEPWPFRWVGGEEPGWCAEDGCDPDCADTSPDEMIRYWPFYLGPCLTPADHAAAVEAAVQAERADCARHIDARVAGWRNAENPEDETVNGYLAFAGQLLSHEIRARGPTDALAAALAKAREDERQAMWAAIRQLPGLHADQALALDQIVAIRALAGKEQGK